MIDLFKFIFSLLILICIHVNPLLDVNSKANLIVSGLLASFAVPYFFVVSGYMSGDKPLELYYKKPLEFVYGLYRDVFGISSILENEFWKNIGINILLSSDIIIYEYLVVLIYCMIICKMIFEKIPDRFCVIICGFTYIVGSNIFRNRYHSRCFFVSFIINRFHFIIMECT